MMQDPYYGALHRNYYGKSVQSELNDIKFHTPKQDANIVMHVGNGDEMLRVTRDGFWVRGVKVAQDDKEAETVYNAFKQWMAWASLTQR